MLFGIVERPHSTTKLDLMSLENEAVAEQSVTEWSLTEQSMGKQTPPPSPSLACLPPLLCIKEGVALLWAEPV